MAQPAPAKARALPDSPTVKLAKFFPDAMPVRIPVRLTRLVAQGDEVSESTTIEFGTTREALFASKLPLEFADRLRRGLILVKQEYGPQEAITLLHSHIKKVTKD